jgi:hypothetical protein
MKNNNTWNIRLLVNEMFALQPMCRALKAFKTEVLKNAYKKMWSKNSNLIVKQ